MCNTIQRGERMKKYKKVIGKFYPEYFLVVEHPDQDVDFYMDMVSADLQEIIDTVAKNLTKKDLPADEMMGGVAVHGGAVKVRICGETIYESLDFTGGGYDAMNNKQFIAAVKKSKYYKIKAKSIHKVYKNGKWVESKESVRLQ